MTEQRAQEQAARASFQTSSFICQQMARPSTSTPPTVDRIVGTSVVLGLAVVLVRWLSVSHSPVAARTTKGTQSRQRVSSFVPLWWLVLALRRWSGKNRHGTEHSNDEEEEDGGNNYGDYSHQGSCQCSSTTFVLRGPPRLQVVGSPGNIGYPHIPTPASNFQLMSGEELLCVSVHEGEGGALGAHVSCGNCGDRVLHADRSSGALEVNAHCVDRPDKLATKSTPDTVSETEAFLGSCFLDSAQDLTSSLRRKESLSSDPTQSESRSTSMMGEADDFSSVTGASMSLYCSSLSVASGAASHRIRVDRAGLPPRPTSKIPSSRMLSSGRSATTMPPRMGARPDFGSSWSVGSLESHHDVAGTEGGTTTISPRMRDQMKKYMQKYT